MVGIEELERHYHEDDFHAIPAEAFVAAAQSFLGLSPQEYPDPEMYDALVQVAGEPPATFDQRQTAGRFVDTLSIYVQPTIPGEEAQPLTAEDVHAWHEAELARLAEARMADPEHADQYAAYSLEYARAAAQKRQTWLTGLWIWELDDNYANAEAIKASIETQRTTYRRVEALLGEAIGQQTEDNLASRLAIAEQRVRERGPVHTLIYHSLAWSLPRIPQLLNTLGLKSRTPTQMR